MSIVGNIIYNNTCELPLDHFLQQLEENCRCYDYSLDVQLIGSSGCKVEMCPKKEWSLYHNSFKPDISLGIVNNAGMLHMTATCTLQKSMRYIKMVFNIIAGLVLILGIAFDRSNKLEDVLMVSACFLLIWGFALGLTAISFERSSNRAVKNLIPGQDKT